MFEKEAEEYRKEKLEERKDKFVFELPKVYVADIKQAYLAGAEFGYNKANEWHKVSDKLPEMDKLVYLWNKINDFPVVAYRYIPYGQKEWVWDCKWGSGFTISQLKGKDYSWKEIVLPKESE